MRRDHGVRQAGFSRKLLQRISPVTKLLPNLFTAHFFTCPFRRLRKRFSVLQGMDFQLLELDEAPQPIGRKGMLKLLEKKAVCSDQRGELLHRIDRRVVVLARHIH